jgi:DeoR/GlpR family transcriptional regulator of sugar metabolism
MYQKERLDTLLNFIQKNGYVTTKNLVKEFHYSVASVNRDLNVLQKQGFVIRSYGGVEIVQKKYAPYKFRQHKMREEKRRISKKACELVKDGETGFMTNDMSQFVNDVVRLFEDKELYSQIAEKACDYAKAYTLQSTIKEFNRILE